MGTFVIYLVVVRYGNNLTITMHNIATWNDAIVLPIRRLYGQMKQKQTVDQVRIIISDSSVLPTNTAQFINDVVGYESLMIILSQPYDVVIGDGNDDYDGVECELSEIIIQQSC